MFHPRLGHSKKVSTLSDFEYRVWSQYVLSADDYGVLPLSPAILRGGNLSIATRPDNHVAEALDVITRVDLLRAFAHQEQQFICDPVWQDFQKISYPRRTYYPAPPPEVFGCLSEKTQELFWKFHPVLSKSSPEGRGVGVGDPHRLEANGNRLTARGKEGSGEEFDAFYTAYPRKVAAHAARRAWVGALRIAPVVEIMAGLQRQLPALSAREKRYIPHPATWLNQGRWKDEIEMPGARRTTRDMSGLQNLARRGVAR